MNKLPILSSLVIASLFTFSCSKKSDNPEPSVVTQSSSTPVVTQQNYPNPVVKIGFTVHVLPSSTPGTRLEGLTEATVTVRQNGAVRTATTDASGIATFSDLVEGTVNVFIQKTGFASLNTGTTLEYSGTPVVNGTNGNSGSGSVTVSNTQTSSSQLTVTLPKLGSSVEGVLRADLDGTGAGTTSIVSSGTVRLVIDNSFEPNVFTASVNSGGTYTFNNLPEGVEYRLETVDMFGTEPASGTIPSFKFNVNFPATTRTTPLNGDKAYLGIIVLQ